MTRLQPFLHGKALVGHGPTFLGEVGPGPTKKGLVDCLSSICFSYKTSSCQVNGWVLSSSLNNSSLTTNEYVGQICHMTLLLHCDWSLPDPVAEIKGGVPN